MTPPPEPDKNGQDNPDAEDVGDPLGDIGDPLKWLESLAARQGANPEEFITSADVDLPGGEEEEEESLDRAGYGDSDIPGAVGRPTPAEARPTGQAMTPADSPLGPGVDPLAWLESLAKRQGANPEEFVTAADLEVPEVPPDAVVDEPGYTPYEVSAAPRPRAVPEPEPHREAETLLREEGELTPQEAAALLDMDTGELTPVSAAPPAAPTAAPSSVDPLSGQVDPLAWLESLARRQGARAEELITAADLDIPEPVDAVIDEPGYVDYSPFAEAVPEREEREAAAEAAPQAVVPEEVGEVPSAGDTLAWLEGLAAEQGAMPQPLAGADPLAGLSDEEIERLAAEGRLSRKQQQAWLDRQAESLVRHRAEAEAAAAAEEALEPAEPGELPDWLQEAIPPEAVSAAEPAPLVEQIVEPPEPSDLPDWLREEEPEEELDFLEFLEGEEAAGEEEVEALPEEMTLEAMYEDPWAAALDEEYVTQKLGKAQEEPDWYRSALEAATAEAEEQEVTAEQAGESEAAPEEELALPEPAELPPWLLEAAPATEEEGLFDAVAGGEGVPDWLAETAPEQPALAGDLEGEMPDWLLEPIQAEEEAELPDWLAEVAPEQPAEAAAPPAPRPEPAAQAPVPPPPVEPAPERPAVPKAAPAPAPRLEPTPVRISVALPQGEAYAPYREKLTQNPDDHPTRLELARALKGEDAVAACLGQYQALVSAEALLSEVEADLRALVAQHPGLPQARRVLGDALMRQGRLQDALDTYRAALEQL